VLKNGGKDAKNLLGLERYINNGGLPHHNGVNRYTWPSAAHSSDATRPSRPITPRTAAPFPRVEHKMSGTCSRTDGGGSPNSTLRLHLQMTLQVPQVLGAALGG